MKTYTFEVFETKKYTVEVDAENGEQAEEMVQEKLKGTIREKYFVEGITEEMSDLTMTLQSAVEIDNN